MDFSISQEQRDLLERLDSFCEANISEANIQQWINEGSVPSWLFLSFYNEFGSIGMRARPEGEQVDVLTRVLLLERLGRHAGATLPFQGLMLDTQILSEIGNDEQTELLVRVLRESGRPGFSLAITEPQSGSDSLNAGTVAVETEYGFVINGVKSFVSSGQYSPYTIILAHDESLPLQSSSSPDHKQLSFFLVPRDTEGVDAITVPKVGQHLIPAAEIIMEDVHVGKTAVVGERGKAAEILLRSYEYGRLYACATTVGMAHAALDQAIPFAMHHTVSGSPIIKFQQIQELIVDMKIKVDAMRGLLYKTACGLDTEGNAHTRLETALLKRYVPQTAMEVADSAMQIMGSSGYMSTSRAARIWKECRGNRIAEGTDQIMTVIAAKRIAGLYEEDSDLPKTWHF